MILTVNCITVPAVALCIQTRETIGHSCSCLYLTSVDSVQNRTFWYQTHDRMNHWLQRTSLNHKKGLIFLPIRSCIFFFLNFISLPCSLYPFINCIYLQKVLPSHLSFQCFHSSSSWWLWILFVLFMRLNATKVKATFMMIHFLGCGMCDNKKETDPSHFYEDVCDT